MHTGHLGLTLHHPFRGWAGAIAVHQQDLKWLVLQDNDESMSVEIGCCGSNALVTNR